MPAFRLAVDGEVLQRRHHVVGCRSFRRRPWARPAGRAPPPRPCATPGTGPRRRSPRRAPARVAHHVDHRRQRVLRAARAGLLRDRGHHLLDQRRIEAGGERDRLREAGRARRLQPVQPLLVVEQRDAEPRLLDARTSAGRWSAPPSGAGRGSSCGPRSRTGARSRPGRWRAARAPCRCRARAAAGRRPARRSSGTSSREAARSSLPASCARADRRRVCRPAASDPGTSPSRAMRRARRPGRRAATGDDDGRSGGGRKVVSCAQRMPESRRRTTQRLKAASRRPKLSSRQGAPHVPARHHGQDARGRGEEPRRLQGPGPAGGEHGVRVRFDAAIRRARSAVARIQGQGPGRARASRRTTSAGRSRATRRRFASSAPRTTT